MKTREIKFRLPFFDRDGKFVYFSYWGAIDTLNNTVLDHGTFVSPSNNNTYSKGWHQQFTGLLDKNRKEIYEGDILQMDGKYEYEVRFHEAKFSCFHAKNTNAMAGLRWGDLHRFFDPDFSEHPIEVIGNIYENKDLL